MAIEGGSNPINELIVKDNAKRFFNKVSDTLNGRVLSRVKNILKGKLGKFIGAPYAEVAVSGAVNVAKETAKTGSIGKGVVGGAIDTIAGVKGIDAVILGAEVGFATGNPVGAAVGIFVGGGLALVNKTFPNWNEKAKAVSYKAIDTTEKAIKNTGKVVSKQYNKVKNSGKSVINKTGKEIQKQYSQAKRDFKKKVDKTFKPVNTAVS